jgi:hypothetical protein
MKAKYLLTFVVLVALLFCAADVMAQCSICTKTASELGEKPAQGLNAGILYLAATPFAIVGFIAYSFWKKSRQGEDEDARS